MKFLTGFFRLKIIVSILNLIWRIAFDSTNLINYMKLGIGLNQLALITFLFRLIVFGFEFVAYYQLYKFVKNYKCKDDTNQILEAK